MKLSGFAIIWLDSIQFIAASVSVMRIAFGSSIVLLTLERLLSSSKL